MGVNGVTYVYNAQTQYWTIKNTGTPQYVSPSGAIPNTTTNAVDPTGNPKAPSSNGTTFVVPGVTPPPDPVKPVAPVTPTSNPSTPALPVYSNSGTVDYGRDFLTYTQNAVGVAGVVASRGDFLHTELYWRSLNGTWRAVTSATETNFLLKWDYAQSGRQLARWKYAGKKLGWIGLGLSGVDIFANGPNVQNSTDAAFGIVGFVPVVGWAVSGAYSLTNLVYDSFTPALPPPPPTPRP